MTLVKAMVSFLEALRMVDWSTFETLVRSGESGKCYAMKVSYCCNTRKADNMFAARHRAERQHLSVKYHSYAKIMWSIEKAQATWRQRPQRCEDC